MTAERVLIAEKAGRMSVAELVGEIARCSHGMVVAASKAARKRFELRRAIMQRELEKKEAA